MIDGFRRAIAAAYAQAAAEDLAQSIAERYADDALYGRGPAMDAVAELRAKNAADAVDLKRGPDGVWVMPK